MQYKTILGSDMKSSAICLGSSALGSTVNKELSFKLMDLYYESGGNFIDTANVYANWLPIEKNISEKTIGMWIKKRGLRNKILIGTKGGHPDLSSMNIPRLSHIEIVKDLDESLKSLQTDFVDIYWLHRDDEKRPVADMLETLNEQVKVGKIRYFGCSNWRPYRIIEAMQYTAKRNMKCFVANQMRWSLAKLNSDEIGDKTTVEMDEEIFKFHKETKLTAIPYSSQAKGFFTKLDNLDRISLTDGIKEKYYNDENIARLNNIKKLALDMSVSIEEIVLGYLISQSFSTIPIVGCKTVEHLKVSLKAGDLKLNQDMLDYLEKT